MEQDADSDGSLKRRAMKSTASFTLVLAAMIFVSAWSLRYWQGWIFLANVLFWMVWTTVYLLKSDPELVENRLAAGPASEREPAQKQIQAFNSAVIILIVVGSVLDHRFAWSQVSPTMVIVGNIMIALGFIGCFFVFRQNSYASATVKVRTGQRVISTGLYGIVRHPMYAASLPLFAGISLALGSYWGLLGLPPIVAGLVARLLDEEQHLRRDLPGYEDYRQKVIYRLVPGIW